MEQKRILIVEDELQITMTLCRALVHPMGGGHQVEVCPLADVALRRLRYERFDLTLGDPNHADNPLERILLHVTFDVLVETGAPCVAVIVAC